MFKPFTLQIKPDIIPLDKVMQGELNKKLRDLCQNKYTTSEQIQNIIDQGADVNCLGPIEKSTPLMYALHKFSSLPVIKTLVENGANVNYINEKGKNVFVMACRPCNIEIISYLYEHISDINYVCIEPNINAICAACSNKEQTIEVIQFLIDHGADYHFKCYNQYNLVYIACKFGLSNDIIQFLIDKGIPINDRIYNMLPNNIKECFYKIKKDVYFTYKNIDYYNEFETKKLSYTFDQSWIEELKDCLKHDTIFTKNIYFSKKIHENVEDMKKEFNFSDFPHELFLEKFIASIKNKCNVVFIYHLNSVSISCSKK